MSNVNEREVTLTNEINETFKKFLIVEVVWSTRGDEMSPWSSVGNSELRIFD